MRDVYDDIALAVGGYLLGSLLIWGAFFIYLWATGKL
jgi:hypothetical protein